ncbi:MAG: tetratricopeptide repeat protein [Candidatus Hermodarchaeota archaeon]
MTIRYPNKVLDFINKKLPKGHKSLEKLIKKNYKKINFEKLDFVNPNLDKVQLMQLYVQILNDIFSLKPNAFELLKTLSLINNEIDTNIDGGSIKTCCNFPNIETSLSFLLNSGIIKIRKTKEERYEFNFPEFQIIIEAFTDKRNHEKAIQYYEKKLRRLKDNIQDEIEILYHKAKINPSEDLVNEFLSLANNIGEFDIRHRRLINIAEELFILEDKYKAPILIIVGNLFSVLGNSEDAEKIYLNALDIYKTLAQQYYKIYLPYVATTQKNLGSLYIDLKRFEEAEKVYNEALSSYKELEEQYYNVHSPDFHSKEYKGIEKSYVDDLKAYNNLMKQYYGIYLPEEPPIVSDFGTAGIDLDLLEDIKDGTIDSMDNYKKLAKVYYDLYLFDIAKTLSNLGITYTELQKFEDAEETHLAALKIKKKIAEHFPDQVLPELVLTLLDLGDLYASLNKFEEAEPMFMEALQISQKLAENNPEVYMYNTALIQNSLGAVSTKLQKFDQAEQYFNEALKIFELFEDRDPQAYSYYVADVQNNLGNLFLLLNDVVNAELYLNKAFKKDPSNMDILYNLACLESLRNNHIKALELLSEVIKQNEAYIQKAFDDKKLDNIRNMDEFKELIGDPNA